MVGEGEAKCKMGHQKMLYLQVIRWFSLSHTSDLPKFRVSMGKALETVGVDFCGPAYIRQLYSENNEMHKTYIVIMTCSTSRMVHLELTPDLSTSAYARSQRRFTANRGFSNMLVSDNGKTFKGGELFKS